MKIVISSTGPNIKAAVDPLFGRAAYLLVYDTDKKEVVEVIENSEGQDAVQGAGIRVAGLLAQKGCKVIITGKVGPKAMAVVEKAGMQVVSDAEGTVEEVLDAFRATNMKQAPLDQGLTQGRGKTPGCRSRNRGQGLGGGTGMGKGHGRRGMGRSPGN
ncbi:MAG: NifB/NifX family molybdenum-iron cluster-binding protein [Proteobacteria bacterium]|nr:NifB/NifX family molybdenum-iron cluster-binding protein [Pseudomonadota bacterium]MBU1641163.1 NifB/NifX family molybdenum-iron cluster-binding protein [Pseudomonadota bacterium]